MSSVSPELIKSIAKNMACQSHRSGTAKGSFRVGPNPNADNTMRDAFLKEFTERPDFKEWFKGSKLVDDNGNPLLLFHGDSHTDIYDDDPTFDFRQHDTWFTTSVEMASHYGSVTAGYVRAEKVFKCDVLGYPWTNIPIRIVPELKLYPYDDEYPNDTSVDDIAHAAIEKGYDAVIIKNVDDDEVSDQIYVKGPVDMRVPTAY